jgi:hypothetical protein
MPLFFMLHHDINCFPNPVGRFRDSTPCLPLQQGHKNQTDYNENL